MSGYQEYQTLNAAQTACHMTGIKKKKWRRVARVTFLFGTNCVVLEEGLFWKGVNPFFSLIYELYEYEVGIAAKRLVT